MKNSDNPYFMERIIAAATYATMGMVGFVWLIIVALTKSNLRSFLKYHIFQSFFLVMALFIASKLLGLVVSILGIIPFLNMLVFKLLFLFDSPLIFGFSIINFCVLTVMLYLVLTSLQGKYSYIPWISNIIDSNVRR